VGFFLKQTFRLPIAACFVGFLKTKRVKTQLEPGGGGVAAAPQPRKQIRLRLNKSRGDSEKESVVASMETDNNGVDLLNRGCIIRLKDVLRGLL